MILALTYEAALTGLHSGDSQWVFAKSSFIGFVFFTIFFLALELALLLLLLVGVFGRCWLWFWEQFWVFFLVPLAS